MLFYSCPYPLIHAALSDLISLFATFFLARKVETNQRAEKSGRGEDNSFTGNHTPLIFFTSHKVNLHADSIFINAFPFSTSPGRLSSLDFPSISEPNLIRLLVRSYDLEDHREDVRLFDGHRQEVWEGH